VERGHDAIERVAQPRLDAFDIAERLRDIEARSDLRCGPERGVKTCAYVSTVRIGAPGGPGDFSPGAPTDPDVRISRIRLLRL
jgi:hypothetical protein